MNSPIEDDNDFDEMEMPCICDCNKVFDLNNGFATLKAGSNKVVCSICHQREQAIEDIENEIEALEIDGGNKREIKKLRKKLEAL